MDNWISTAERLPEFGERVLIARHKEVGKWRVEQAVFGGGGWWHVCVANVKKVPYWMPLPEPPA